MESWENLPTAADYANDLARNATRKAQQALTKSITNEQKIDEIHTMTTALLLGLFGREQAKEWIKAAELEKRTRNE